MIFLHLAGKYAVTALCIASLAACQATPPQKSTPTPTPTPTQPTTPDPQAALKNSDAFSPNALLPMFKQAQQVARIKNPLLNEISGMAFSKRSPGTLWVVNDSGNAATLFAIDTNGNTLAEWPVAAPNRDWEDLATTEHNGDAYLLIADIGDNLRIKNEHAIYVFREPESGDHMNIPLEPVSVIRFRYSDGKHNAESIASDGQSIFIASKVAATENGAAQSTLYSFPFTVDNSNRLTLVATPVAQLFAAEQSIEAKLVAALAGVDLNQPTAMDIDTQHEHAYVLSYRSVLHYARDDKQSWAEVFASEPTVIHNHRLAQAEALAVAANGTIWFSSEKQTPPLWVLPAN